MNNEINDQAMWSKVIQVAALNASYARGKKLASVLKLGVAFLNAASEETRTQNAEHLEKITHDINDEFTQTLAMSTEFRGDPSPEDVDILYYGSEFLMRLK